MELFASMLYLCTVCLKASDRARVAQYPVRVTRGTSSPTTGADRSGSRTQVDYLTISCEEDARAFRRCLSQVFDGAVAEPAYEPGPGMRYFERSQRITIAGMPSGVGLTGDETQRGRARVDLSGVGCGFVPD